LTVSDQIKIKKIKELTYHMFSNLRNSIPFGSFSVITRLSLYQEQQADKECGVLLGLHWRKKTEI